MTPCAAAGHRPGFDSNAVAHEMRHGVLDPARPLAAQVAVPGRHGHARDQHRSNSRAMDVELLLADAVRRPPGVFDDLGTDDIAIEGVRSFPVGDVDDDVVETRHDQAFGCEPSCCRAS